MYICICRRTDDGAICYGIPGPVKEKKTLSKMEKDERMTSPTFPLSFLSCKCKFRIKYGEEPAMGLSWG